MLAEDGAARFVAETGHHLGVADEVGEEECAWRPDCTLAFEFEN